MLMVSGIGPKEILTQHKIPVIVDRPVGQNWQVSSLLNPSAKKRFSDCVGPLRLRIHV